MLLPRCLQMLSYASQPLASQPARGGGSERELRRSPALDEEQTTTEPQAYNTHKDMSMEVSIKSAQQL